MDSRKKEEFSQGVSWIRTGLKIAQITLQNLWGKWHVIIGVIST